MSEKIRSQGRGGGRSDGRGSGRGRGRGRGQGRSGEGGRGEPAHNRSHENESNGERVGTRQAWHVKYCEDRGEKKTAKLEGTDSAYRFLQSLRSVNPEDALHDLSLKFGDKALQSCINELDYTSRIHWEELISLIETFGRKIVFCGLQKEEIVHVCTLILMIKPFRRRLQKALEDEIVINYSTVAWMVAQVVFHDADFGKDPIIENIRNYLVRNGSADDRRLLANAFGSSHLEVESSAIHATEDWEPRHDNDFPRNFHDVQIVPTVDELNTPDLSISLLYRDWSGSDDADDAKLLDRQFRLLRADMVATLREEIKKFEGKPNHDRRLEKPVALSIDMGEKDHSPPVVKVKLHIPKNLISRLKDKSRQEVAQFLKDEGQKFLSFNSVVAFLDSEYKIVALGTIEDRNIEIMAENIFNSLKNEHGPHVEIGMCFRSTSMEWLLKNLQGGDIFATPFADFAIQLRSTFFSQEPVLKCLQDTLSIPLREELVMTPPRVTTLQGGTSVQPSDEVLRKVSSDSSQLAALHSALNQRVTIVQGPPGTGKTFLGVQIVNTLLQDQQTNILCLCYTNHALDSFLESLLDNGIESTEIVRMGSQSKVSEKVKKLCIQELNGGHFSKSQSRTYFYLKEALKEIKKRVKENSALIARSKRYFGNREWNLVKDFLENSDHEDDDINATMILKQLKIPQNRSDGFSQVGKDGRELTEGAFWSKWHNGEARPLQLFIENGSENIWSRSKSERILLNKKLFAAFVCDIAELIKKDMEKCANILSSLQQLRNETKTEILSNAKILACTTTFAAKNKSLLDKCQFRAVIVEEAAEILESHVLINISEATERLIMIGDHLQLRPKLEYYPLRVDSGQGVDFDRSLFERLVISGYPFATLEVQYRMRPEISQFIRSTYPKLRDHETTRARQQIKGTYADVAFIDHSHPESKDKEVTTMASLSKTNEFEVKMIVRMVQYFLQQGYQPKDLVILTPYLSQLMEFRRAFRDTDMRLDLTISDRDMDDLENAGADDKEADLQSRDRNQERNRENTQIRVATIDNFQGEESNIIIASLVRSNGDGIIGFVGIPERINVLFSRARDGFYVLGNSATLRKATNPVGRRLWTALLNDLESKGCVMNGFPAYCPTHSKRRLLASAEDFDTFAKHGGCGITCGAVLATCPHRHLCNLSCHPLLGLSLEDAHAKVLCSEVMEETCPRGLHKVKRKCCERVAEKCTVQIAFSCDNGHSSSFLCSSNRPPCKLCRAIQDEKAKLERENIELLQQVSMDLKALELENLKTNSAVELQQKRSEIELKKRGIRENIEAGLKKLSSPIVTLNPTTRKETSKGSIGGYSKHDGARASLRSSENFVLPSASSPDSTIASSLSVTRGTSDNRSEVQDPSLPPAIDNLSPDIHTVPNPLPSFQPLIEKGQWSECLQLMPTDLKSAENMRRKSIVSSYHPFIVLTRLLVGHKLREDADMLRGAVLIFQDAFCDKVMNLNTVSTCDKPTNDFYQGCYLYALSLIYLNVKQTSLFNQLKELRHHAFDKLPKKWKQDIQFMLNPKASSNHINNESAQSSIEKIWAKQKEEWKRSPEGSVAESSTPSEAMDSLLKMTGLQSVKEQFLTLYCSLQLKKEQGMSLGTENLNTRFDGNPGTGKTTVANLLSDFLIDIGILPKDSLVLRKTGSELANAGVSSLEKALQQLKEKGGGVVFVDEAYQLNDNQGHRILDFILGHAEKMKGDFGLIIWVFAGYQKQMDDLFKHNPGLPSRFPKKFVFADYTNEELQSIFQGLLDRGGEEVSNSRRTSTSSDSTPKKVSSLPMTSFQNRPYYGNRPDQIDQWGNTWRWDAANYTYVDDYDNVTGYGTNNLGTSANPIVSRSDNKKWCFDSEAKNWYNADLPKERISAYPGKPRHSSPTKNSKPFEVSDPKFIRIAIRRLGHLRGTTGFGNARAVRNLFNSSHRRLTKRITSLRSRGQTPNIHLFERDDLLGPRATKTAMENCEPWCELEKLEGLTEVKDSLTNLMDLVVENADREDEEKPLLEISLNRVFLGNPGTGKTTVAKLYARILSNLGLLSKGEVILKNASDFVGDALGKSETTTRSILEQASGSVLVIDEAYGLFSETGNGNEPYREAVINTLVEQIQGVPGEDRAIVLLGYQEEMERMLAKCNPGLARRFQLENAFIFTDYDDDALTRILIDKVQSSGLKISPAAAIFAVNRLAKARAGAHFGNAGAVGNLLSDAKLRMMARLQDARRVGNFPDSDTLIEKDFVPEGWTDEPIDPAQLLSSLVGCDAIRDKLEEYCSIAKYNKSEGCDIKDNMSFNFIFTGSPGTGKTTVARLMGKMFCSLGLIPCDEVVETSASDLITGYVGQAGKATREKFEKARGKVLFIDEAYQLNPQQGGSYMQEVVDEIVKLLTSEEYKGKIVVILAGYADDMNNMLKVNAGLRSRFSEFIHFDDFSAERTSDLILKLLSVQKSKSRVQKSEELFRLAERIIRLPGFANGRDIDTLVKKAKISMIRRQRHFTAAVVTMEDLRVAFDELALSKDFGTKMDPTTQATSAAPLATATQTRTAPAPPKLATSITTSTTIQQTNETLKEEEENDDDDVEEETQIAGKGENAFDLLDAGFLRELQTVLDSHGLNSASQIQRLSCLSNDTIEITNLLQEIAQVLSISYQKAEELWTQWKTGQDTVQEHLAKQEEEKKMAIAQKRKALVPIWRCGVCSQADMPYIVCYVAPFIVRYEERELK